MIDLDGIEWLPVGEAAERIGAKPRTVSRWHERGKVLGHVIDGRLWVRMDDVMDGEHKTRGKYAWQRTTRETV